MENRVEIGVAEEGGRGAAGEEGEERGGEGDGWDGVRLDVGRDLGVFDQGALLSLPFFVTRLTLLVLQSAHSKDTSSVDAVAASLVYNVRPLLTSFSAKSSSSFRLSLYPFNAAFNWAPSGEPVPLSTLASQPLSTFALSFRRGLTAHRSLPSLLSDWRSRDPKTLPVPFRDRPQPPSFLRWLFPRQHVTRHLISDQTGLGLADLRLPDKDGVDLPLHTFYMTGHSPVYPDHVATLQKSVEGDYTLFAAMRRERWACLMRAIEGLRDNDDGVYGGEQ